MYLKGIELQGFKSFADKIDLEFGQGITTIVGPNGSGKSNISDAIRWVLGEQSAKSLRGGKMEDVIFAGTQRRAPLGYAQVSIILDNKDKTFKIDYDKIKVTRRVHRSGESNYLINDKECRLKDIHELFMDTGIGREGYSVIGQGKIDQILSSKAEERRNIFEEASGITKYKYRKAESEKKLLQTEDNLIRIRDLLSELEAQVGPLETQSKKARKYLDLREVLKGLDINISIRNIDKLREALTEGKSKFTLCYNQLADEKNKLLTIETAIERETASLGELNEEITNLRQQSFDIEKNSGSLSGRIEILKNNINNNNANKTRLLGEIDAINTLSLKADDDVNSIKKEIEDKKNAKAVLEEKVMHHDTSLKEIDDAIASLLSETDALKDELSEKLSDISASKAKISSLEMLMKNFDERKASLVEDLKVKKEALEKAQQDAKFLSEESLKNKKAKDAAFSKMEKLKSEYFELTDKLGSAKEEQNKLVASCNDKESRKTVLEDLERGYEGYAKSVKNILSSGIKGVNGVVSKLIEVDTKFVTAVEIALGAGLQNVVVDDEDCAKKCISYLKENHFGRATFLPLTSVKASELKDIPASAKGYIGVASDLAKCDKKYEAVIKNLIGRTLVMDNIDNAVNLSKKTGYKYKIVTLDGQLVNPGGSLTGGSVNKTQSLLSRSKDIEKLSKEIESLRRTIDDNDDVIAAYNSDIRKMAVLKEQLEGEINTAEREEVRLNSNVANNERIISELNRNISTITDESGAVLGEIEDIEKQKESIKSSIALMEQGLSKLRASIEEKQQEGISRTEEREKFVNSVTDDRISLANADKDIALCYSRIDAIIHEKESAVSNVSSKNEEIASIDALNEEIQKEIQDIEKQIDDALKNTGELSKLISDKQSMYEKASVNLKDNQKKLKEQNETIYVLQLEVSRIENRNSKTEMEVEVITNKLWDEYELTYNAAMEYKRADFNMTESQKEAASLRAQIKSLGNINIDSIEQYKEVKERFDFLSAQKQDLDETKAKLEDIIREMQTIMVKQFKESFEIIRTHFDVVFKALFGGGSGRLSLSDPDNVLESGIDIEVQPPGKKLQNMMALSGGEKALSAIALLFSVLEVRPTPFCILDEVEAALDDNNVYRFADYIRKYSEKTQFIVVTHRRGTMEAADIMYGVTMQEKGVSKLLKLKFEDLEDYS